MIQAFRAPPSQSLYGETGQLQPTGVDALILMLAHDDTLIIMSQQQALLSNPQRVVGRLAASLPYTDVVFAAHMRVA
jgi:hypothetical protein